MAFRAVMPLIRVRSSGSSSRIRRVFSPKRCTSFSAVAGPTPFTTPEER